MRIARVKTPQDKRDTDVSTADEDRHFPNPLSSGDLESCGNSDEPADPMLIKRDCLFGQSVQSATKILRVLRWVCVFVVIVSIVVINFGFSDDVECTPREASASHPVDSMVAASAPTDENLWPNPPSAITGDPFWADTRIDLVKVCHSPPNSLRFL